MLIGMDYLWYIEKLVFHIISIQIMGQSYGAVSECYGIPMGIV